MAHEAPAPLPWGLSTGSWRARLSGDHLDLAVLRSLLALLLLSSGEAWRAPHLAAELAALPPAALPALSGTAWIAHGLGVHPGLAWACLGAFILGALLALEGRLARLGLGLSALSGLYLLGIVQLEGSAVHVHHLLWLSALLALVPASAPRLALRGSWFVLACVYFFPGLHKLLAGWGWVNGETLRHHLWWKWAQGVEPLWRVDLVPGLVQAGAQGVLVFELAFPLLLCLGWRGRVVACLGGLVFHRLSWALMGIAFSNLWPLLLALLPWSRWLGRERVPTQQTDGGGEGPRLSRVLVALLCLGVALAGLSGRTQAWPLACYPTFAADPGELMPDLAVVIERLDGTEELLPPELIFDPRRDGAGVRWQLAGVGQSVRPAALEAWWAARQDRPGVAEALVEADTVGFYRVERPVKPGAPVPARGQRLRLHVLDVGTSPR